MASNCQRANKEIKKKMIESKIINLLQKKVTEVVGKVYPVKYINTNMGKVDKFWEIIYIPNNIENEFWAEGKTYRGILRLILHWPQDNKGIYKPMEEAERVADGFKKGLELFDDTNSVKVTVTDDANCTGAIEDEGKLLIPLTIKYLCFKL